MIISAIRTKTGAGLTLRTRRGPEVGPATMTRQSTLVSPPSGSPTRSGTRPWDQRRKAKSN